MGYASGANSASASGQQYRGSSRRRQRDPVRRALTLPNLIAGPHNDCYSLACLLMSNECDQSRIAAWHECRRRDSGSNRTNMIDPSGAQVQWQPQQNSPSHIRHSGQLSSVPIAIFTPTSGFRSTAGHQSAGKFFRDGWFCAKNPETRGNPSTHTTRQRIQWVEAESWLAFAKLVF